MELKCVLDEKDTGTVSEPPNQPHDKNILGNTKPVQLREMKHRS